MQAFKFKYNRVRRAYTGGFGIDTIRQAATQADGMYPEDWIASAVNAYPRPGEPPEAGLSIIDDEQETRFVNLLTGDSEALLGEEHLKHFGPETGFLMKLLDSNIRLPVQVHPDNRKALELFNSPYGKTEAWLILATRSIADEEPYLLIGFNEKLDKDVFVRESINGELISGLDMMHKVQVKPGDIYMISGGLPHAIGPGLTVIEIMEPSDWIAVSERLCGSIVIDDARRFNQLEPEKAMTMFDFSPLTRQELMQKSHIEPIKIDSSLQMLIDRSRIKYFGLEKLTLNGSYRLVNRDNCCRAGIVVEGHATVNGSLSLRPGDTFFLPACMPEQHFTGTAAIVMALPPACPE